jgi:hypothetical protein
MMLGTLNYMAPEQVRGERIDQRADIFSFGVVLYEILSGRKAFHGDSFASTLYKILQDVPEPLLNINATLPYDVVMVVEKAMAKGREDRYQDLTELSKDLAVQRQHLAISEVPTTVTTPHRVPSGPPLPSTLRDPGSGRSTPASGGQAGQIPPEALTGTTPLPAPRPRSKVWLIAAPVVVATLAAIALWLATRNGTVPQQAAAETPSPAVTTPSAPPAAVSASPASAPAGAPSATPTPAPVPAGASGMRTTDAARTRMFRAKAAARQAGGGAVRSPSFAEGLTAEREGERLYQAKQMTDATARFYEAAAHFRSAELAAGAADRPPAAQAHNEPSATPATEPPAPSTAAAPAVPSPPATTTAPPPEPVAPAPLPIPPLARNATPPPTIPAESPKALEDGVRELIRRYEQALESRSIETLRRVWPSLQGAQETAIGQEFANTRRIDVEISNIDVTVSGQTASATFVRRYQLFTVDGQSPLRLSRTTLNARRNGGDWLIERVRFEAVR